MMCLIHHINSLGGKSYLKNCYQYPRQREISKPKQKGVHIPCHDFTREPRKNKKGRGSITEKKKRSKLKNKI